MSIVVLILMACSAVFLCVAKFGTWQKNQVNVCIA